MLPYHGSLSKLSISGSTSGIALKTAVSCLSHVKQPSVKKAEMNSTGGTSSERENTFVNKKIRREDAGAPPPHS